MKIKIEGKEWEVVPVKVKDLIPNPKNPRTITKENFERLKRKIKRQGFRSAIQVDNDGIILGGNQRYAALMEMGYAETPIPVIRPCFKMTEKDRQEAIVTDNIFDGAWNTEMLANEYDQNDLAEWGYDIPHSIPLKYASMQIAMFSSMIRLLPTVKVGASHSSIPVLCRLPYGQ